jgi:dephospho-CoA kinase
MITIGITGTIGSGKSTVAGIMHELGAAVINADEVGHEVYLPGTAGWDEVVNTFGEDILAADLVIDRYKLGELVFNSPEALSSLDAIMRPIILEEVRSRLAELRGKGTRVAVLEAALLVEAGWEGLVDELWVTTAPLDVIMERLAAKKQWSPEQIRQRIAAQNPVSLQIKSADLVIDTDKPLPELKAEIAQIFLHLKH